MELSDQFYFLNSIDQNINLQTISEREPDTREENTGAKDSIAEDTTFHSNVNAITKG